ncbi:glutathione S-transferase family protein [Afifella sp. IM 167]|uniref:glutathione S-transferase family protein n=1 Tax=Afifella sp. IM 167 TaxID=2033586 RepID=UPI001CD02CFA|nr:glutathione S-transferase [Afifella sp. IM 167]MBZ8134154.1 glutathione S-transferase [Afifella sp. IM 167]
MKLLDGGRAPNPRRVRIFLAEKGIEVPVETIDIGRKEHYSDAFLRLNPMRRLPVLVLDDGTPICETMAICRYFEALQPEPSLFGRDAREIATIEMWNRRMELDLLLLVASVFRHSHPAMAELEVPQIGALAEASRGRVPAILKWLDTELRERDFIAGEDFSVADITGLVAIDFMKPARLEVPEELAALRAWHERVKARPSAAA